MEYKCLILLHYCNNQCLQPFKIFNNDSMSIYLSKGKLYFKCNLLGNSEPSELANIIIKQFVRCSYIEDRLTIPEKNIFLN